VFSASVLVTGTAVLGGIGLLPAAPSYAATHAAANGSASRSAGAIELSAIEQRPAPGTQDAPPSYSPPSYPPWYLPPSYTPPDSTTEQDVALPADSGSGRRVVFDTSDQRVWLVKGDGSVKRTYPVSGSVYDNLDPGTYSVYSRSPSAVGIDDSGTMKFMVRFAHGANAAIGFHDIPIYHGEPVQTLDQLGTPLSHGCIRQARPDAKALWRFAPLGTTVVVTA
jgi:lipoprotein-anchoring transpeptidase ErfK/SrfK